METDEAGADQSSRPDDVEAGDEVVVADVTFGWGVHRSATWPRFSSRSAMTSEAGRPGRHAERRGSDSECEAVDEWRSCGGGYVRVRVEGSEYGTGGQRVASDGRLRLAKTGARRKEERQGTLWTGLMERADMAA